MEPKVVFELETPEELRALYQTHPWFEGRAVADIRRSIAHTDEFVGLRSRAQGTLVAAARVITDYVYTGKVLDVIVDGALRRQGLGTKLMAAITGHPELQDVETLTLNCREGVAPFYEACGFCVHHMIQEASEDAGEDYFVMVYS